MSFLHIKLKITLNIVVQTLMYNKYRLFFTTLCNKVSNNRMDDQVLCEFSWLFVAKQITEQVFPNIYTLKSCFKNKHKISLSYSSW